MNQTFRRYILPKKNIDPGASQVNGLTFRDNQLHYRGKAVHAIDCRKALEDFFDFLRDLSEKCNNIKIILAAHNGHSFDFKHLFRVASFEKLPVNGWTCVDGCLDTYPLTKFLHPNLLSYKQEFLVKTFLMNSYEAHSALHDAYILQKLVIKIFPETDSQLNEIIKFIKTPSCFYWDLFFNCTLCLIKE